MVKAKKIQSNKFCMNICYLTGGLNRAQVSKTLKGLKALSNVWEKFFFEEFNLQNHRVQKIEVELTLCGQRKIKSFNKLYRNKNKATDVLSFPIHENMRDDFPYAELSHSLHLGNILVCKEVALKQAKQHNLEFWEEVTHLVIHGLLHLIGYDHELSKKDARKMFSLEEKLVKLVGYERLN